MSQLGSALPAFTQALQEETERLNELVTVTVLQSLGGQQAVAAYQQQIAVVKQAAQAHQQTTAAAKSAAAAAADQAKRLREHAEAVKRFTDGAAASFGRAATFADSTNRTPIEPWRSYAKTVLGFTRCHGFRPDPDGLRPD